MKENFIFILAFALIVALISYINSNDIEACVKRGHTAEHCAHAINR